MTVELEVKFDGPQENASGVRAAQLVELEVETYIPRTGMEFTEVRVKSCEAVVTQ